MSSSLLYIILGIVYLAVQFFENKNKKAKESSQTHSSPDPGYGVPHDVESQYDDYEIGDDEIVEEEVEQYTPVQPEVVPENRNYRSMTEDFYNQNRFEEGSLRGQHSSQYEMSERNQSIDHTVHPVYDQSVDDDVQAMTSEEMRKALVYQMILERPEF